MPRSSAAAQQERTAISRSLTNHQDWPHTTIIRFDWSQGRGALACHGRADTQLELGELVMSEAANSFRLALERQLAVDAIQDAEALQRSRAVERALTRRLGHELRTPLTAIQGFSSTMLQADVEWPDHDKQRFLEIIQSEAGRMNRLVDQLFDDSAIESGTLRLNPDYCDLVTIIENAINIGCVEGRASRELPDNLEIWADQDRLQQVFVNLIGNSQRHNPGETLIRVAVEKPSGGDTVRVTVHDNGTGLPQDVTDFVNGKRDDFSQDRGLGFRLARGFIRAHDGVLTVESGDNGTEFHIELPIDSGAS